MDQKTVTVIRVSLLPVSLASKEPCIRLQLYASQHTYINTNIHFVGTLYAKNGCPYIPSFWVHKMLRLDSYLKMYAKLRLSDKMQLNIKLYKYTWYAM